MRRLYDQHSRGVPSAWRRANVENRHVPLDIPFDSQTVSIVGLYPGDQWTVAFDNIDAAGHTILTMSDSGPNPPAGLQLGNPGTYFDISTTASFSGGVDVSIDYSAFAFTVPPEELRLFHYEADQWRDCTSSVDEINRVIRGRVYSLSPFVILEPAAVPAPGALLLAGGGLAVLGSLRRRLL